MGIAYKREVLLSKIYNDLNYNTLKKGSRENNKNSVDAFPLSLVKSVPSKHLQSSINSERRDHVLFKNTLFFFSVSRGLQWIVELSKQFVR